MTCDSEFIRCRSGRKHTGKAAAATLGQARGYVRTPAVSCVAISGGTLSKAAMCFG
jgi:hypothetical protein